VRHASDVTLRTDCDVIGEFSVAIKVCRPPTLTFLGRIACTQCDLAWSVCLCAGVMGTRVSCAKTAEPIEIPFGVD